MAAKKPRVVRFFDLDNTLCWSKQVITPKVRKKIFSLIQAGDIPVIVSGASKKQILKQMDGLPCIPMGQNGNEAPDWNNKLTTEEIQEIWKHLEKISETYNVPLNKKTFENRGCQISFSFTGHNAPSEEKKDFDPSQKFRNTVLSCVPFKSKKLIVQVAGTTCLDYTRKNRQKGDNLKRYMELNWLSPTECVYYGDNFSGNDKSVIGVMMCVEVKNPDDLLKKL